MSHVKQSPGDCRDPTKPHLTLILFPHLQKPTLEGFVDACEAFMFVFLSVQKRKLYDLGETAEANLFDL